MNSQFLRVYRKSEEKEILINLGMVWKIDVTYAVKSDNQYFSTDLTHALNNPEAIRFYEVFAGSERVRISSEDSGAEVFDAIYKNALKG